MAFELEYEDALELEPIWIPRRERFRGTGSIEPGLYETGVAGQQATPSTSPTSREQISMRITVVGHASPRWRTARNITDADRLNQRLSEARANNVRAVVANILKKELPGVNIDVGSKGVGSRERFPGPYGTNWSIDRSVVVTVDLTAKYQTQKMKSNPPRRIFAASKFWEVTVVDFSQAVAGVAVVFLRILLKNAITGKRIVLSGTLGGGGMSSKVFDFGGRKNPGSIGKAIGNPVVFETAEALMFEEFDGQIVRVGKADAKLGIGADTSYLTFPLIKHSPGTLTFDHHRLAFGWPKLEGFVASGKLHMEGMNPGDWFEVASLPDLVPVPKTSTLTDGIVLTFPTGRASFQDLTQKDRKRLEAFVTNKARNTAVFLKNNYAYVR